MKPEEERKTKEGVSDADALRRAPLPKTCLVRRSVFRTSPLEQPVYGFLVFLPKRLDSLDLFFVQHVAQFADDLGTHDRGIAKRCAKLRGGRPDGFLVDFFGANGFIKRSPLLYYALIQSFRRPAPNGTCLMRSQGSCLES